MNNNISKKTLREFSYLVGFGVPLIFGWLIPFLTNHSFRFWTLWIGTPILFVGLLYPRILQRPYKMWMSLGFLLGFVNSRLILGIVYILVLIPIALFMKSLGYDPLRLKASNKSTFKIYNKGKKVELKKVF